MGEDMTQITKILILIIFILSLSLTSNASTLFLENWGISPGNWIPGSMPSHVKSTVEDYTANGPGFVGPGWGGQPFDAEAAYLGFKNSKVYIAIVTGMPQTGSKDIWRYNNPSYRSYDWNRKLEKYWYDPGDIGIAISKIGVDTGDVVYNYAITTRSNNIHSSGVLTPGAGMLLSGSLLWENPKAWDHGSSYTTWNGVSDPWAVKGYDNALNLGSNFQYSAFGEGHYAIEAIIDYSLLGLKDWDILNMHWVMECGNDNINLSANVPETVPEPSTILLLGSGFAGLAFYRKNLRPTKEK